MALVDRNRSMACANRLRRAWRWVLGLCHSPRVAAANGRGHATVADIYYQQVLNNLARFDANPAAMPSFSVVSAGTVNIEDSHGASSRRLQPDADFRPSGGGAFPILSMLFGAKPNAPSPKTGRPSRDRCGQFRRMRCAFQSVVGRESSECDRCKERLEGLFYGSTESFDCMLPRGGQHVGCRDDVPERLLRGELLRLVRVGDAGRARRADPVHDHRARPRHRRDSRRSGLSSRNIAVLRAGTPAPTEIASTETDSSCQERRSTSIASAAGSFRRITVGCFSCRGSGVDSG